MSVYLDYNSSAPIDRRVLAKMVKIYEGPYGNADSRTHDFGTAANGIVEAARAEVAELLSVAKDEVFFTSGATESNNIAIQGLSEYAEKTGKRHIISSSIEHKAIINTLKHMQERGFEVNFVSPELDGRVKAEKMLDLVREDTLLVCLMHVNNETGIIQPINEIGEESEKRGILFHTDATQSAGKLVGQLKNCKYNMLSCSAHKFYGPQGIGALILKRKEYKIPPITPIMYGGQQEHGISPGTTPVALVAGFGKACENALKNYEAIEKKYRNIQIMILDVFNNSGLKYHINGDISFCVPNTLNICIEGVSSEALMLSSKQYCGISNGSACTSKNYSHSYVLEAMGLSDDEMDSSIRVSWGEYVDINSIKDNIIELVNVAKGLVL